MSRDRGIENRKTDHFITSDTGQGSSLRDIWLTTNYVEADLGTQL